MLLEVESLRSRNSNGWILINSTCHISKELRKKQEQIAQDDRVREKFGDNYQVIIPLLF